MQFYHPRVGEPVLHLGQRCHIKTILDVARCVVQPDELDARPRPASFHELSPVPEAIPRKGDPLAEDLSGLPDRGIEEARRRLEIIRPLFNGSTREQVREVARQNNVDTATIYRWISSYRKSGMIVSLVPLYHRRGAPLQSRLLEPVETIVTEVIETFFLTEENNSIAETALEIKARCLKLGLPVPAVSTVRNRKLALSERMVARSRRGKKEAKQFAPIRGSLPGAHGPWSIVHIDHTKLDMILVDRVTRQPLGRAWITLAEDAATRMVVGFFISLDDPNALAVGLCIVMAMLPKENWLLRHGIAGNWPVWGKPEVIHVDNAEEFRGKMLQSACGKQGTHIHFRRVGHPEDGGRLERLNGTINRELHRLPGTTRSNPTERGEYDSEGKASFTLDELERYIADYIINSYHQRPHRGLGGKTPLKAWEDGLLGNRGLPGLGLPTRHVDENALRLSFLPFEERTVQPYGIALNEITYWHDHLRHWIGSVDPHHVKRKRKFQVHYDPRDLSRIWFFDPALNEHIEVRYRDTKRPAISQWELEAVRKELKKQGVEHVNEEVIFSTRERLRALAAQTVVDTKAARRARERTARQREGALADHGEKAPSPATPIQAPPASRSKPAPSARALAYEDIEN